MKLESVVLLGQQITRVESPFRVQDGVAELLDLRGTFLGGELWGRGWVTLDATPSYSATMSLAWGPARGIRADARRPPVVPRQHRRPASSVAAWAATCRTLQGLGEAHITDGDLGELPAFFRLFALVNRTLSFSDVPRVRIKTAFDSVDLAFTISHGLWSLDPIKFTGNAFSLQGRGTLDPQTYLDLRLGVLLGRDRFHIPIVSDLSREASARSSASTSRGRCRSPTSRSCRCRRSSATRPAPSGGRRGMAARTKRPVRNDRHHPHGSTNPHHSAEPRPSSHPGRPALSSESW